MKERLFYVHTVVREGLSVEMTFEQRPNEMRKAENIWGEGVPGRGDSEFKGPVFAEKTGAS